jgi:hypothetical protein
MSPPRKSGKRKRLRQDVTEDLLLPLPKSGSLSKRSRKTTNSSDKLDKNKCIDDIYSEMEGQIKTVDELLWHYIPMLLVVPPKESKPKKISDFYEQNGVIKKDEINDDIVVKCRIRGIGRRYFDLRKIKTQAERSKIIEELKTIHDFSASKKNRRLDSLARLLEGNHTCVAVFHDERNDELLITANDIIVGTSINEYQIIADTMEYFKEPESKDREKIFQSICIDRIKSLDKRGIKISVATIKRIANYVFLNQNWEDMSIKQLMRIATNDIPVMNTYEQSDILRIFPVIGSLSKDFRKVENSLRGKDFKILTEGRKGVHAELRMLDYLLKYEKISFNGESQYIGISKLCCPRCEIVIGILNLRIKTRKGIKENVIETRGEHGVSAGDKNWKSPDFLDNIKISMFPQKTQEDIADITTHHFIFRIFLSKMQDGKFIDYERYMKASKILNLIEGKATKLLRKEYYFWEAVEKEKNIIKLEKVLKSKETFISDKGSPSDFVMIQEGKYLDLNALRRQETDFNEVYRDLFLFNFLLVQEERKQANLYASQSSSDEGTEGIVKKLDNIISELQKYVRVGMKITQEKFVQAIEDELSIKLEESPSKNYSSEGYIEIIKNIKKIIKGSEKEIDDAKLAEIIKKEYDTPFCSEEELTANVSNSFVGGSKKYAGDDVRNTSSGESLQYNDQEITVYKELIVRNKLGGFVQRLGNQDELLDYHYLLKKKFPEMTGGEEKQYYVAVMDAVDTQGKSLHIDYFFDKTRQPSELCQGLSTIIEYKGDLRTLDAEIEGGLASNIKDYLTMQGFVIDQDFAENIAKKLVKCNFDKEKLQEKKKVIEIEQEGNRTQVDVFDEIMPVLCSEEKSNGKIVFPYNRTNVHWLTGEILIQKQGNHYKVKVFAHDPYGGGKMEEQQYRVIMKIIGKRIIEEHKKMIPTAITSKETSEEGATFECSNEASPFSQRQHPEDGDSCGIIVARDMMKRICGKNLNTDGVYEVHVPNLLAKHRKQFQRYNSTKPSMKKQHIKKAEKQSSVSVSTRDFFSTLPDNSGTKRTDEQLSSTKLVDENLERKPKN